ncbi:helix-turn-helix domain-containing protein [Parapedobacter deserti]|uniref:Helix-turn-helix domain-containing protein n=1 Tax=Parapedobacter deserti TaxID=1912957 RepID=A0ABV7JK89_9SPHI
MAFGDRLAFARKQRKMTQGALGGKVGTSGDIIGKYERGENMLSIDVAAKMADALGVTLDYLVKDGEYEHIDNETLKRLKEVQGLDSDTRAHVFATIDAFIKAARLKSIAAL